MLFLLWKCGQNEDAVDLAGELRFDLLQEWDLSTVFPDASLLDLNDEDLEEGLFPPESLEPELGRILRELDRKLEPEGLELDSSSLLRPLLRPCLEPRNEEVESIRP